MTIFRVKDPIFAPLAHPWETRLRISLRNGAERLKRYSLNFASQFARFTIAGTVQSSMAAALGYDTRYHHYNCKGGWKRTGHALSRTFVTYDSFGRRRFDVLRLSRTYAGSMLMMDWYPRGYGLLTNGVRNGNLAGITAAFT